MKLPIFQIEERQRRDVGFVADREDFVVSAKGQISSAHLLDDTAFSVYCFDAQQREAVFVELPAGVDLARVPFIYQTQYDLAQRVVTVPLGVFNELAGELPAVARPIFVHMTGRSGSTLLHHAFNETGVVASLSEPDAASQFADLRYKSGQFSDAELQTLAESTLRFLFKAHHSDQIQTHAVKFRNQGTLVMDIFQAAFPEGRNLFLYRDVEGFVASFQRLLRNVGLPEHKPYQTWRDEYQAYLSGDLSHMSQYVGGEEAVLSIAEQLTLWWLAVIEWYLAQREQGVPAKAVGYAEMVAEPEETLVEIFQYCGLSTESVALGLEAFARDSQAGTAHARENPLAGNRQLLSPAESAAVKAILVKHPVLDGADFVMP